MLSNCTHLLVFYIIDNNCNNCLFIFYCLTVFCLFQIEITVILSKIKNKKSTTYTIYYVFFLHLIHVLHIKIIQCLISKVTQKFITLP